MKNSQYIEKKTKALQSFFDFADGKGELPKWPLEIFLEISNVCDLKCAMCETFSAINSGRFFNLKKADRGLIAIDSATEPLVNLLEHALIVHAFGYGEPTIHPQFKEVLRFLSRYEVMIDFFTNGMHLDDELCQFLVEEKISKISVSFSGSTAEEYENIYLGGNYQKVLDGIKRLSDKKEKYNSAFPVIEINSLAFNHHIQKLPEFVEMMGDVGATVIHVKPLSIYPGTQPLKNHVAWMDPDRDGEILDKAKAIAKEKGMVLASMPYERTYEKAKPIIKAMDSMSESERKEAISQKNKNTIPIADIKNLSLSDEMLQANKEKLNEKREKIGVKKEQLLVENEEFFQSKKTPCFEPLKTFYASFDGTVFPCCFKGTKKWIGSLNDSSGEDIWNNDFFTNIKSGVLTDTYSKSLCEACIRKGSYPKHHSVSGKVSKYAKWFDESYAAKFDESLLSKARALPDNQAIVAKYKNI